MFSKYSATFALLAYGKVSAINLEREPLLTWAPSNKKSHPVDYFVPNFGVDSEIRASQKNLAASEKRLNHKIVVSDKKPAGHPVDYYVPNFGTDSDILRTQKNLANAESSTNHKWVVAEKKAAGHPVDYFVPNFGADSDILSTQKVLADTE